jgi:hypothetical protein
MPAAYAHITLVNLFRETRRLRNLSGSPVEAISAIMKYFRFCELGAVSPDYPYLVMGLGSKGAKKWADIMHYTKTTEVIRRGAEILSGMSGASQEKGIAWLMGYAAHVVTDVSVHPVVELKVGPYKGNEKAHRICEMHQDVHIYQRLNMGGIGLSEHLKAGIGRCGDPASPGNLDPDIKALWSDMLQTVHPREFKKNSPKLDKWHSGFLFGIDKVAEEGGKLIPLARHVALDLGIIYPASADSAYIQSLKVPNGTMDYDGVFDKAVENVAGVWNNIARSIFQKRPGLLASMTNWNLDTGKDESKKLIYWS